MASAQSQNPNIVPLTSSPGDWVAEYDPATNTTQIRKASNFNQDLHWQLKLAMRTPDYFLPHLIRQRKTDILNKIAKYLDNPANEDDGVLDFIENDLGMKIYTEEEWRAARAKEA